MVEIFVEQISERLIYTLDFVFIERGLTYKLNNDFLSFQNSSLPKLNYSNKDFNNILQLYPSSVLFDEVIREYEIGKGIFENEECLIFDEIGVISEFVILGFNLIFLVYLLNFLVAYLYSDLDNLPN